MDDAWISQLGLGRLVRTRSVLGYVVAPALGKLERRADRVANVFKLQSDISGFNPGISPSGWAASLRRWPLGAFRLFELLLNRIVASAAARDLSYPEYGKPAEVF